MLLFRCSPWIQSVIACSPGIPWIFRDGTSSSKSNNVSVSKINTHTLPCGHSVDNEKPFALSAISSSETSNDPGIHFKSWWYSCVMVKIVDYLSFDRKHDFLLSTAWRMVIGQLITNHEWASHLTASYIKAC